MLELLQAHPHQWGEGKVHQIIPATGWTLCGRSPNRCPGTRLTGTQEQITCGACLRKIEHDRAAAQVVAGRAASWRLPRVYLAGKMSTAEDWRGEASPLSRNSRSGVTADDIITDPATAWLQAAGQVRMGEATFVLTGPFPTCCDHGCAHSSTSLHMAETCDDGGATDGLLTVCFETIKASDIVCAQISARQTLTARSLKSPGPSRSGNPSCSPWTMTCAPASLGIIPTIRSPGTTARPSLGGMTCGSSRQPSRALPEAER